VARWRIVTHLRQLAWSPKPARPALSETLSPSLEAWYEDVLLEGWLGFLDDYEVLRARRSDKEIFQVRGWSGGTGNF
jgi:hypothetical protein